MKHRRELVLKGFLNQCPPDRREALERFLPHQEQKILSELPIYQIEAPKKDFDFLEKVHWSWYLPTLKSYSEKEQNLFLLSLDSTAAAKSLGDELHLPPSDETISKTGKKYLRGILFHSLVGKSNQLLPVYCLPPTPLNALLSLSKKELTHLIDDLSLYDLASELRQIVETKILKRIYSFLTGEERKFLKAAMAHKETFSVPRVGLDRWDGTEESFRHLLHRRGLARLGEALSSQDPDLVWYVCHQLDIGRGNALFKLCEEDGLTEFTDAVLKQIEEWLSQKK